MPAKGSIITSHIARSAAIGCVMFLLLAGSLGLAWGLTGAPITRPNTPAMLEVPMAGGTLRLPEAWALESVSGEEGNPFLQWVLVNQTSPAKRLRVVRFTATQPTDPNLVLSKFVLPQLLAGRRVMMVPKEPLFRSEQMDTELGTAIDLVFSTQRLTSNTSPQLHAVRLLSPDQKNFWVFQLTDQVPFETWNRGLEISHVEHLRRWLAGFSYDDAGESGL